ncbi:hypothetical protein [Chthoniobacter sp.]|uniref:hypothetical protein n=1 Tax=Chthoniobacter sp. TaxID=2510640 RepID=UPI0032AEFFA1
MWHGQPSKPRRLRKFGIGFLGFLGVYLCSYIVLSFTGGWVVSQSGELRMILAVDDIFEWQPRYGQCQWFRWVGGNYGLRADRLGYFYAPLILLDQRHVHRTIRFLRLDGTFVEPFPAPPLSQYHPLIADRFAGRLPYERTPRSKPQ